MAGNDMKELHQLYFAMSHGISVNKGGWYYQQGKSYGMDVKLFVAAKCVCVFLAFSYDWVTVMHEIPISSAQTMTSFHTLELSSTIPLVPLKRGLFHMRRFQRVRSI
jgi:hypothetical protein